MFFLEIVSEKKLDLFSFFPRNHSVTCPKMDWLICVQTSLRRKHEVLILESPRTTLPPWDNSKRWCVSSDWVWISPRSLSFIKSHFCHQTTSFLEFRDQLSQSK
jgi:hypothetical protein